MDLKELIKSEIENVKNGQVSKRVKNYNDLESKYAVLKPKAIVHVELTKGVVADIDISDYFEEVL